MSFNITIEGGKTVRLKTAGKYCDRDIVATATGGNEQKAFEAGRIAEWNTFWDAYQNNGTRGDYGYAFMQVGAWTDATFKPKYDIKPTSCFYMFYNATGLTDIIGGLAYNNVTFDTSKATSFYYAFCNTNCSRLPHISLANTSSYDNIFAYSSKLKTIDKLTMPPREYQNTSYNNTMFNATATIENIIIGGIIYGGFNISRCNNLTHDSLMSIINALNDYVAEGDTTTTRTLSIGATNIAKLTSNELKMITDKGWTYA